MSQSIFEFLTYLVKLCHKSSVMLTDASIREKYQYLEKLGEGAYGLVYKGRNLQTDKLVAIKKIKPFEQDEGISGFTLREIGILTHLKHPNIISLIDTFDHKKELYLVFEYMDYDLKQYINSLGFNIFMNSLELKRFSYFLFEGIRFCHANRILHRDLKPSNILISKNKLLKIADFGLGMCILFI